MKIELCPACKSNNISSLEVIPAIDIARVFSKIHLEAGQVIMRYLERGEMPATVHIDKCNLCGLEFANPPFAGDVEWYSKVVKYGMRWDFSQCLKDLPAKPADILEIGCGEGYFLELATRKGYRALGIDFNETAIKSIQAKGVAAYVWDIKELYKYTIDRKFDAVALFHVIENIDDPEALLADLARIMPRGSSLHLSCPGPRRYTTYLEPQNKVGLRDVWDYPPDHQTRWNQTALNTILSRFSWRMQKYIEEPFDWKGISGYLVSKECIREGRKLSDRSWLERKIRILKKMFQIFVPSLKYKGFSVYCMAIHQ